MEHERLAEDSLQALGWPASIPVPKIDLTECLRSFALDAVRWTEVCKRSAFFYMRAAFIRYDPSERLEVMRQYEQAAKDLRTRLEKRGKR